MQADSAALGLNRVNESEFNGISSITCMHDVFDTRCPEDWKEEYG